MIDIVRLNDGRVLVPDNRWDLVESVGATPSVAVVIPYYDQPEQLRLVLAAVAAQNYPAELLDVVIADDGSSEPPDVERWASRLSVTVVSQEDKGFRAAAARNLGARASTGEILCFLDADTVPTPDYVRRAVALPAVAPDVLVVGRRKHADLSGVREDSLADWIAGNAHTVRSHDDEPRWLVDGYQRTSDLLEPGWDGYKYVISAVMTCSRDLFDRTEGFEESFVRYGGEDWEFANRAFMMGAVLAHEPRALAWHDGPDWAQREVEDRTEQKNGEALVLAQFVTDPAARTSGLGYRVPDCIVMVSTVGHSAASLFVMLAGVLRTGDNAVWLDGPASIELYDILGLHDSRVRVGSPDAGVTSRSRFVLEVTGRVNFSDHSVAALAADLGPGGVGRVIVDLGDADASVTMTSSRAAHRCARWSTAAGGSQSELIDLLFGIRHKHRKDVGLTVATDEPWLSW